MATSSSSTMNVKIKTEDNNSFRLQITHSDTVFVVKAKIFEITGTPISNQMLVFQGSILENNSNVQSYSIARNSRLLLLIEDAFRDSSCQPTTVMLFVSIPRHPKPFISIPMDSSDTVLQLKMKLLRQHPELSCLDRMGLYTHKKRHELQDAKFLRDYGLSSGSKLDVFLKPALLTLAPLSLSPSNPQKKMKIQVLTSCGKELCLRVNPTDQVGVLRLALKRLQSLKEFQLASEYFFIHQYYMLDETVTFLGNHIEEDDVVEIVHGTAHYLLEKLENSSDIAHMPTCRFSPLLGK